MLCCADWAACCARDAALLALFEPLLLGLYELETPAGAPELLAEEEILAWAQAAAGAPEGSPARQCHDKAGSLLAWLRSDVQ